MQEHALSASIKDYGTGAFFAAPVARCRESMGDERSITECTRGVFAKIAEYHATRQYGFGNQLFSLCPRSGIEREACFSELGAALVALPEPTLAAAELYTSEIPVERLRELAFTSSVRGLLATSSPDFVLSGCGVRVEKDRRLCVTAALENALYSSTPADAARVCRSASVRSLGKEQFCFQRLGEMLPMLLDSPGNHCGTFPSEYRHYCTLSG